MASVRISWYPFDQRNHQRRAQPEAPVPPRYHDAQFAAVAQPLAVVPGEAGDTRHVTFHLGHEQHLVVGGAIVLDEPAFVLHGPVELTLSEGQEVRFARHAIDVFQQPGGVLGPGLPDGGNLVIPQCHFLRLHLRFSQPGEPIRVRGHFRSLPFAPGRCRRRR